MPVGGHHRRNQQLPGCKLSRSHPTPAKLSRTACNQRKPRPPRSRVLSSQDNGSAWTPRLIPSILSLFHHQPTGKGTGLGPATDHYLVNSNGGLIHVEAIAARTTDHRASSAYPASRAEAAINAESQNIEGTSSRAIEKRIMLTSPHSVPCVPFHRRLNL